MNTDILICIISYLYLFFCLHNYYYNIIFIYFFTLFIFVLIFKKYYFIISSLILIIHFLYINISKEGNTRWDNAYKRNEKRNENTTSNIRKLDMNENESQKFKNKTQERQEDTVIKSDNYIYN